MLVFTCVNGNPTLGDGLGLPDLASVNDFTICCFFRQTGYGGAGTIMTTPYIKCLTSYNNGGAGYGFYFSDYDVGAHAAAGASWNGTGGETTTTISAATLSVLHSFVLTKTGSVIKYWLDGSVLWTASGATSAATMPNIRIGCYNDGVGHNQYFQWAQIGQWALFKRGWTTGEIAAFDGGRDNITQHSEDIFTTLGISRTSISYYLPLVSSVAETVSGATVTTIGSPILQLPAARIRLAQIAPGDGDLLYIEMKKISDSSDTLGGTYNGGLTITPPSGSPIPLTLTQCATKMPFIWAPLDQNFEAIQSDTDAAKTGGTWTANGTADNSKFGWHNSGDVNRFTMSYGSQFSQSSAAGAVATWTFSSVPPGKYIAVAIYHADSNRTSSATYTVKDGATTVKTFTQDQRVTMRNDTSATQHIEQYAVDGRRAMVLGPDPKLTAPLYTNNLITITTGTTVTIAVSNTAGSGVLTANLMALRRIIQPYPTGSVLNAPSGWCTTAVGDAEAVVNFPVDPPNINTFMPFNAAVPRTMKVGYGIEDHKYGRPSLFYANRMLGSDGAWQGSGFTVDADQNLLTVTGYASRTFEAEPIQRSYDGFPLPTIKEFGTWTVKYTIVTGTPSVTIQNAADHGEIMGTPTTPTLIGGKMVFTQTIDTRGTVHPGCANLYVQVSGGAAKVEIYGPEVPAGWTSMYHPSLISLLANRGFDVIRNNPLSVSFNESQVDWTDAPSETTSSVLTPRTVRSITLTSAGPANRADLAPWYGATPGYCAVLLTTATPHGIRSGDFIYIDGASTDGAGWGITTTLGTASTPVLRAGWPMFCVRVDATNFIWQGYGPNVNEVDITDPNQCITLSSSHAISGTLTVQTGRYTPLVHLAGLCNECNIRTLHINMPMAVTDAYVTSLADRLAAVLGAGKKVRLGSRGNEIWNFGFPTAKLATIWEHHTQWLWDTTSHAQGAPVGVAEGYAWLAWRLQQDAVIFRARFALAGRPSTDVITVLESQLGGSSHTSQACDFSSAYGITPFDEVAVATYRDLMEANDPTNANVGYTTNFYAGFAAVSDASAVSLLWLGQKYSLMVGLLQNHRGVLDASSHPTFHGKPIVTYEGGDQNIAFGRPRPSTMYRHPLMYRKELAVLQMLQNDGGLSMEDRYLMNYPDGPEGGSQWNDFLTSFMDVGTGDPAEGQNPLDMRSGETSATFGPGALSQTGGARRFFASTSVNTSAVALASAAGSSVARMRLVAFGDENMQFNTTDRNARLSIISTSVGTGGTVKIYSGAAPGIANTASGTLLVTLPNLVFAAASAGAMTFSADPTPGANSGTPGYGRLSNSGGTAKVEFACAVGSGEANFTATISSGGTVTLSSATITEGNS